MSIDNSIPATTPALSLPRPTFHAHHDKGTILQLRNLVDVQDTLDGCCANLVLIGELFTTPAEHADILNCDRSRYGMYQQLMGIVGTLESISAYLGQETTATASNGLE